MRSVHFRPVVFSCLIILTVCLNLSSQSTAVFKFATEVPYNSGAYGATSVAIADLNGDGIPDIVMTNQCVSASDCTTGAVDVLLSNGNGTFQAAVTYSSGGSDPASIAVADVNKDGILDLVIGECSSENSDNVCLQSGLVAVLLGNGNGSFQSAVTYASGSYETSSVAVADVNGDGIPDIVASNFCPSCSTANIGILFGNGDGTFQGAVTYSSGGANSTSVAVADVNGDGIPDLLVANQCSSFTYECIGNSVVGVLLGSGDGKFENPVAYSTGETWAASLAVSDVNGDGFPDLVVADLEYVSVLLGEGNGTFRPAVNYSASGTFDQSVKIADMNGDGIPDLVVSDNGPDKTISVLAGNGDGTFQTPIKFGTYDFRGTGISVAVADLNKDGRNDIVIANHCTSGCPHAFPNSTAGVLLNTYIAATTMSIASSANPSQADQLVKFTTTITSVSTVPNGSVVSFYNGSILLGTATTKGGAATFSTSFSAAKTYTIKASYAGDSFHKKSSRTLKQVVN
jgi:hypothetical protein